MFGFKVCFFWSLGPRFWGLGKSEWLLSIAILLLAFNFLPDQPIQVLACMCFPAPLAPRTLRVEGLRISRLSCVRLWLET